MPSQPEADGEACVVLASLDIHLTGQEGAELAARLPETSALIRSSTRPAAGHRTAGPEWFRMAAAWIEGAMEETAKWGVGTVFAVVAQLVGPDLLSRAIAQPPRASPSSSTGPNRRRQPEAARVFPGVGPRPIGRGPAEATDVRLGRLRPAPQASPPCTARPFVIAVVVTVRGFSTDSDPEPALREGRPTGARLRRRPVEPGGRHVADDQRPGDPSKQRCRSQALRLTERGRARTLPAGQ
ncbi:DUF2267 domain-containing protein [Streptomyces sp. NPDC051896]|uniref:DUF2267 domain-containing protein n=1 Tax=Streptomyces sp. NPDC051896 TaxID=3155416 RepID=UPI00342D8906